MQVRSDVPDAATGPMIHCGQACRTHAAVRERAHRAAHGFSARGIGADDAVALLLRNDVAVFEASLAAALAGAYAVPLNPDLGPETLAFMLRDCGARALVAHADLLAGVADRLPPGTMVLVVAASEDARSVAPGAGTAASGRGASAGFDDWDGWVARQPPIAAPVTTRRPAVIYTSGSTGRPKGVRRHAAPGGQPSARARAVYGLEGRDRSTVLITGPMHHAVPNAHGRLALDVGADIVLQTRFEPEILLALVARHRVTHMHVVPAMLARLLALPAVTRARHDTSSLRHVVHGGAHCPPALKRAMFDWWGAIIHEYYGSTETGLLTLIDPAEARAKPGSVGRALPGITLEVLDREGRPLPPGRTGRIFAGSSTLHRFTYVGLEAKRVEIGHGTLVTAGDLGVLDADGYLTLRDREGDVIEPDGEALYPSEIEAVALGWPDVQDCAAFGIAADPGDACVCLCVEPAPGRTLDTAGLVAAIEQTVSAVRGRLRVEILPRLPRQDTGKIFKAELRDRFRATG